MASSPETRFRPRRPQRGVSGGHAEDSLEEIVRAYIDHGYTWVGITEHMPPERDALSYPDELAAGLNAVDQQARFARYMAVCRRLRDKYASQIRILVAFETEGYSGYESWVPSVREAHEPDYIVGSVHQINDEFVRWIAGLVPGRGGYGRRRGRVVLRVFRPAVRDDHEAASRGDRPLRPGQDLRPRFTGRALVKPLRVGTGSCATWRRSAISVRSWTTTWPRSKKARPSPTSSRPVLEQALKMGIAVVPGDDSHGVGNVDRHWDEGIRFPAGSGV